MFESRSEVLALPAWLLGRASALMTTQVLGLAARASALMARRMLFGQRFCWFWDSWWGVVGCGG